MSQTEKNNGNAQRTKQSVRGKGKGKGPKGPRKGRSRAMIMWLFFIGLFALVCAVVGYLLVLLNGERILSTNINKLNLAEATVIVDSNNKQIAKISVDEGNREFVAFGDIPKLVQDAFIATEDKRFYEHPGVDLLGIGRALVKDIIARSAVEGASTITQQLAKNLFLNADKTIFRKGTEASIALALEQQKSKEEILELYLNRIYFGGGQYGILTAAKYYFDNVKTLDDLKIWQIATLAALPKAPTTYNPIRNPNNSMERRAVILKLMFDQGLITEKEKNEAAKVVYKAPAKQEAAKYQTFVDYAVDEALEKTGYSEEALMSGGYTIQITINTAAQLAMEEQFAKDAMFEKSNDEIKVQGSMVIMDQHDGSLIAMIGGRDYEKQGWNRVTKKRQPGSSFKPIVAYGPAIDTGNFFPWTNVEDVKRCFGDYCPSNSNKNQYLGSIPMKQAIKESRNISAVWLLNEIGVSKGMAFAEKLGITLDKKNDRNLAIALGGLYKGASPLEMARAYAAFANGGVLHEGHSVLSITNSKGDKVYEYKASKAKQVMSADTAYYVTQLLQGVVQKGGTGVKAAVSGHTVAGKTGTTQAAIPNFKTNGNRDVWFVGYTPEWTAAVWYGYDETNKEHYLKQGSGQAAAMFSAVMTKGLKGVKKQTFPTPQNLQKEEKLDAVSGLVAQYSPEQVSVELSWAPVEGEGITYKIYRKGDGEAEFRMAAEIGESAYDDLAILPDQSFIYYVTAFHAKKKLESEPSAQVSVTVSSGMEVIPPVGEEEGEGDNVEGGEGEGGIDEGEGSPPPSQSEDPYLPPIESEAPVESPTPSLPITDPIPSPSPSSSPSPSA
jgi:penicillin-binding protein 2A